MSIKNILPKSLLILFSLCSSNVLLAQTNPAPAATAPSSANQLVILLGSIALVLAFVIYGMGQVLITLGRQALEKTKKSNSGLATIVMLIGLSLLTVTGHAQDQAAEVVKAVPNYGGLDSTGFWVLVSVLGIEIVVIFYMMFSIQRLQAELLPKKEGKKAGALGSWWSNLDKKIFTKAVAVEKEADVLLDHDYDGIKELDNALPPWWKYGFLFTIVVAMIYLLNFHVFGYGKNPTQEYEAEMQKAEERKAEYEAKNKDKIDENNLQMPDKAGIEKGKDIFNTVCWACHGKLGEGGAGPNLTDDYWIHKGSLTDVYQSIKHGYPDKGMQSWAKNYTPKEINDLAGFILTLKGTNPPNAKAPQGDLFTEAAAGKDSTGTAPAKADSTSTGATPAKADNANAGKK
ncbi:MAG: c-type cytochrome [Bacteroidetes bacterium]|nr:c-type cytochrome [Bacteroidota bacterium]